MIMLIAYSYPCFHLDTDYSRASMNYMFKFYILTVIPMILHSRVNVWIRPSRHRPRDPKGSRPPYQSLLLAFLFKKSNISVKKQYLLLYFLIICAYRGYSIPTFSGLINGNKHNSRFLFSTINQLASCYSCLFLS